MGGSPFGGKPQRGDNGEDSPDVAAALAKPVLSTWPAPYDTYAGIYRVGKFRLSMNPEEVDRHYMWQFKALLGLDQPTDPTASPTGQTRELTRAQMAARSQRLRNLDPDVAAERIARARSRNRRRERQRSDPEWREEVKRNRAMKKEPKPERVVQAGDPEGDIVIVR